MKKKETALLLENWRKFLKEENNDDFEEDNEIFRSFDDSEVIDSEDNVLDGPTSDDSDNFYASDLEMSDTLGEEESDDRDHYLRRFCELVGINCDDKQELANYFADQAAKSGVDSFGNEFSEYSKYDMH